MRCDGKGVLADETVQAMCGRQEEVLRTMSTHRPTLTQTHACDYESLYEAEPWMSTLAAGGWDVGWGGQGHEAWGKGPHGKPKVVYKANGPVLGCVVKLNVNGTRRLFLAAVEGEEERPRMQAWGGGMSMCCADIRR